MWDRGVEVGCCRLKRCRLSKHAPAHAHAHARTYGTHTAHTSIFPTRPAPPSQHTHTLSRTRMQAVDLAADSLVRSAWTFVGMLDLMGHSGQDAPSAVVAALQFADSTGSVSSSSSRRRPGNTGMINEARMRLGASTGRAGGSPGASPGRAGGGGKRGKGGAAATGRWDVAAEGGRGSGTGKRSEVRMRSGAEMTALEAYRCVLEAEASASRLQTEVSQRVTELGFELETEFMDAKTGYSLDLFIPEYQCAVEVDGPFHYHADGKSQLGSSVMKHRHLRQRGIVLVVIPFFEWNAVSGGGDLRGGAGGGAKGVGGEFESVNSRKLAYLRAKFDAVLPAPRVWPASLPGGFNLSELDGARSEAGGIGGVGSSGSLGWREGKAKAAAAREAAQERYRVKKQQRQRQQQQRAQGAQAGEQQLQKLRDKRGAGASGTSGASGTGEYPRRPSGKRAAFARSQGQGGAGGDENALRKSMDDDWISESILSVDYVASGYAACLCLCSSSCLFLSPFRVCAWVCDCASVLVCV